MSWLLRIGAGLLLCGYIGFIIYIIYVVQHIITKFW